MGAAPSKGVFVRPRFDYALQQAGWAGAFLSAVVGQFNVIGLYNDSSPQVPLALYSASGVSSFSTPVADVFFRNSKVGSLIIAGQPVVAGNPTPPGSIYGGQTVAALGTDFFGIATGQLGWLRPPSVPIAIINPGWGIYLQTPTANLILAASFLWAPYA